MTLLTRWDAWLRRIPTPVYLTLLLAALVVHTGVWAMPNYGLTAMQVADPFGNPFGPTHEADYLLGTWFVWFVTWLIGIAGPRRTVLFTIGLAVVFLAAGVTVIRARVSPEHRRLAWLLFFALPAAGAPLYWAGGDSMTLLLMVLALAVVDRPLLAVLPGIALGMQHSEQGLVGLLGVGVLVLLRWVLGRHDRRLGWFVVWWGAGIVLGRFALRGIWAVCGVDPQNSRFQAAGHSLVKFVFQFLGHPGVIVWSGLGVVWLVVALLWQGAWRTYTPLVVACLVVLATIPVVEDQTRVFAIVAFPVVMLGLVTDERALTDLPGWIIGALALAWLAVPWIWVWRGIVFDGVFPQGVAWAMHQLTGHGYIPRPFGQFL